MGTLYLVRHGQASFGADDYDQLSALGQAQARRLGEYWRESQGPELRFDAVLTGTLRRQVQTWQGIAEGAALADTPHTRLAGLNEYDSHAVIAAIHPEPLPRPDTPERYRAHFRLLRQGLAAWMRGETAPAGMPSYADFVQGVDDALAQARTSGAERVLLVSSGGPIATAVSRVLQAPPEVSIELNLHYRNTAVSELNLGRRGPMLVTYNTLPHLVGPAWRDWVSYA